MNIKFVLASFVAAVGGLAASATPAKAGTDFRINLNLGVPRPPAIIVEARHDVPSYGYHAPAPRGYWKDVTVKTWVPERWVVSYDRRGRAIRRCEPGYFTYRTDRVWVEYGREAGYGYGRGADYGRGDNCYVNR